jgi:hypothetical protein
MTDQWNHCAAVFDRESGTIEVYLNGELGAINKDWDGNSVAVSSL